MDSDTLEKLRSRTYYMINSAIDVMQTTFLTPLPGTRLFKRLNNERRLLYNNFPGDWQHYDMTEVIHRPLAMASEKLARIMKEYNKKLYSWPVLLKKALLTLVRTKNPMAMMFSWSSNNNYRNVSLS